MTPLHARTTILLSGVVLFVASGFADAITVNNATFEDTTGVTFGSCGPNCQASVGPIPGWISHTNPDVTSGLFQPGPTPNDFFNFIPSPITVAYSNGGTIEQTVANTTVQEGITYTLTVELGKRFDQSFAASANLLLSGAGHSPIVVPAMGTPPTSGNWDPFMATFTGSATNAGDSITIQLNSSGAQANFDNVELTATAVPEPSMFMMLSAGLLPMVGVKWCLGPRRSARS